MTPKERRAAREKILAVQRREDREARMFLRTILQVAGARGMLRSDIMGLAVEAGIYRRAILRARRQMGLPASGGPRSRWSLPEA